MVTPTGLESASGGVLSGTYVSAPDAGDSSTRTTCRPHAPDAAGLPSAVPSFLEACARLAGRAAAEGNFAKARELIEKAARVAEIGQDVMAVPAARK
jgi:hypothetical protein